MDHRYTDILQEHHQHLGDQEEVFKVYPERNLANITAPVQPAVVY